MPYSHHSHSGQFCKHAVGTLEQVVLEAIRQGFHLYGLTEHVPRYRVQDLYPEEAGMSPDDLMHQFIAFLDEAHRLKAAYASRITLLVGLETEYVTDADLDGLSALLDAHRGRIEYIVGSVHHVHGIPIDFDHPTFGRAVSSARAGEANDSVANADVATGNKSDAADMGDEAVVSEMNATARPLRVTLPDATHTDTVTATTITNGNTFTDADADAYLSTYLDAQYHLLTRFHPEVVGHLDVCRVFAPLRMAFSPHRSPRAWTRLRRNVAYVVGYGALFEVNAAAFRKGWGTAYPGEEVLGLILEMGGRLTLSDDSHGPQRVGENYDRLRGYLQKMGVEAVWYLTPARTGTDSPTTSNTPFPPFERGLVATRVPGDWRDHAFWKRQE